MTNGEAGLNCIAHLLSLVPYEEMKREPFELPERQPRGDYVEPDVSIPIRPGEVLEQQQD